MLLLSVPWGRMSRWLVGKSPPPSSSRLYAAQRACSSSVFAHASRSLIYSGPSCTSSSLRQTCCKSCVCFFFMVPSFNCVEQFCQKNGTQNRKTFSKKINKSSCCLRVFGGLLIQRNIHALMFTVQGVCSALDWRKSLGQQCSFFFFLLFFFLSGASFSMQIEELAKRRLEFHTCVRLIGICGENPLGKSIKGNSL